MVAFLIIVSTPYSEGCKTKTGGGGGGGGGTSTSRSGGQPNIWLQTSEVGKMKIKEGQQVMKNIDKIHSISFRGQDVLIYDDHSIEIPKNELQMPMISICFSLGDNVNEEVEIRYEQKGVNKTTKANLRYRPNVTSVNEILREINSSICISEQDSSVNVATSLQSLRQIKNPLFNACFQQV